MHFIRTAPLARTSLKLAALSGLAFALFACSSDTNTPSAPNATRTSNAAVAAQASPGREQQIAQALALALKDSDVRAQVRDAMRASLVDGHKLVLQEFAQTTTGRAILRAAAREVDVSLEALDASLAALPPLDFYMPIRMHRRTWQGTANVLVVATLDRHGPFTGYTPAGEALSLAGRTRDQLEPLFLLHPAESKGRRVQPQASTPGLVIEDQNDGAGSERFTYHAPSGDSVTVNFADPNADEQLARVTAAIRGQSKIKLGDIFKTSDLHLRRLS